MEKEKVLNAFKNINLALNECFIKEVITLKECNKIDKELKLILVKYLNKIYPD